MIKSCDKLLKVKSPTVEPQNKGHGRSGTFVLYSEVVPISEVHVNFGCILLIDKLFIINVIIIHVIQLSSAKG